MYSSNITAKCARALQPVAADEVACVLSHAELLCQCVPISDTRALGLRRGEATGQAPSTVYLNSIARGVSRLFACRCCATNCNECGKDRKVWGGLWHVGGMHLESVFRGVLPMDNKRLCFCGYVYQAKLPDIVIKAAKAKGSNG